MKRTLAFLTGIVLLGNLLAAEAPLFKVGLTTDTHIKQTLESCKLVRGAFEVFKDQNVDMVVNLGDIADRHYPTGYAFYRQTFREVFGENAPKEILIYANHDTLDMPDWDTAFAKLEEEIGASNKPYDFVEMKGYPFLIYPQRIDIKRMEREVKDAIAKYPGKPIFMLDHVPARDTVDNSSVWGEPARKELLDKYPQVVHISGHSHNSLYNEKCIWQGGFTAVDAGCLQVWEGSLVGCAPPSKRAYEVLVMEVYPEKLVFRRFSVLDKKELKKDRPWTVKWPYNPAQPEYSQEARAAKDTAPAFPDGAALTIQEEPRKISFSCPIAKHPDGVYYYKVELQQKDAQGAWETYARQDECGEFYLAEDKQPALLKSFFSGGFFDNGKECQLVVTPMSFFEIAGKPISIQFTPKEQERGTVVFESKDPMKECPFKTGLANGDTPELVNGYYKHDGYNNRLIFPEGIWDAPTRTRFRFIVDFRKTQPNNGQWTVVLREPKVFDNANARISTMPGEAGLQRMVIDFSQKEGYKYYMLIREGYPGLIRFEYVRVEHF